MKFSIILKTKGSMIRKMWLNQFAFSLFGLFVASPFTGVISTFAGIFSFLFYAFVMGYAILDDAQKDKISYYAGRLEGASTSLGFKYSFLAFLPTIIITFAISILSFTNMASIAFTRVIYIINRLFICGEVLGIDAGLARLGYDENTLKMVSEASKSVLFICTHGFIQLIFAVFTPLIFGIIYYLGFSGVISVNTTEKKRKK